jgi:hypothetical protein
MPGLKYTAEVLAIAAAQSTSVAGVLRHLGVRQSGGSHAHISRQMKRFGIDTSHFKGSAHNRVIAGFGTCHRGNVLHDSLRVPDGYRARDCGSHCSASAFRNTVRSADAELPGTTGL